MGIFWEWHQQGRINQAESEAASARQKASSAQQELVYLRVEVERMRLVTQALWTLVRDELKLTDEQLAQRVYDIDLSDGKLDGQVRHPAEPCPSCGRVVSRRRPVCMYCGTALPVSI